MQSSINAIEIGPSSHKPYGASVKVCSAPATNRQMKIKGLGRDGNRFMECQISMGSDSIENIAVSIESDPIETAGISILLYLHQANASVISIKYCYFKAIHKSCITAAGQAFELLQNQASNGVEFLIWQFR